MRVILSAEFETKPLTRQKVDPLTCISALCYQTFTATSPLPGADKFLARPERNQARKHVRDARDFNNIETQALIKFFFPARQGAEGNSRHFDRNISLLPSWSG